MNMMFNHVDMLAITICQPYAQLIVRGEKLVENREWYTKYRGPLLIHAGLSREWLDCDDEDEFAQLGDPLIFGSIIGVVNVKDVLHIDHIRDGQYDNRYPWLREHDHTNGTWCWVLQHVQRFRKPVRWKGAQRLWSARDFTNPA